MTDINNVYAFSYMDQNLDELSISNLRHLHITLKAVNEYLWREIDKPCYWADDMRRNTTGKLLEGLGNYIDAFDYNVIKKLEAKTPMVADDIQIRAEILLPFYIEDYDLTTVNVKLAEMIDDLSRAKFCEKHGTQYRPREAQS